MYYPIYLELRGRKCVVVGGGGVATRKVQSLLAAEAEVSVVAPLLDKKLSRLATQKKIRFLKGTYQSKVLQDCVLVIAATDDEVINEQVFQDAEKQRILVNVVDQPARCNFIVPAVVKRGPLTISISTGGKSPLLARRIREDLEKRFGREFGKFLVWVGKLRKDVMGKLETPHDRKRFWEQAIPVSVMNGVAKGKWTRLKKQVEHAFRGRRTQP